MKWSRVLGYVCVAVGAQASAQSYPSAYQSTYAGASSTGFDGYKARLTQLARSAGVGEATIAAVIPGLALNSRVVQLDRGQPGQVGNPNATPPFAPYRRAHVSQDLIDRGRALYSAIYPQMQAISADTGVDPGVMLAIFGHETSYGRITGSFDLPQALATLAYDGRRRGFFEAEFVAALKLIDRGVPRYQLKGSWAGATGYPQFMPSTILRIARDGDGDGRANVWTSRSDGLASIGAYLANAGWKRGVHWGIAVSVPDRLNRYAIKSRVVAPRCPQVYARHSRWLTLREWRALGIAPLYGTKGIREDEQLSLLEPDGPGATAYLLSHNYRVILDYNCSNFYALSVGLLADLIERR
ncbi:lytic murein transglycosylase [Sphingomonas sp. ASV193]|uniref:lytic murein transglycosylase n=1 Tax=Sphingomonas sp. ASV193 TaxID=3144405 RepID=UPI0032E8B16C